MIHLRSTSIQSFLRCREEFRQHYLNRRVSAYSEIHREFGVACHRAAEIFWHEGQFQEGLSTAAGYFAGIADAVHPSDKRRYEELKDIIPDCIACFWDNVEYTPQLMLEKEWSMIAPWNPDIVLSGRIDRVTAPSLSDLVWNGSGWSADQGVSTVATGAPETVKAVPPDEQIKSSPGLIAEQPGAGESLGSSPRGPVQSSNGQSAAGPIILTDLKTCSEIEGFDAFGKKVGWERSYHDANAKSFQLGLYDWALRQMGLAPTEIQLECLMKPYARYGKKAGLKYIPMPEVIAYRERFDMILEWITQEIYQYVNKYSEVSPWPMTESACSSKYGNCYLMAQCGYGTNRQTEKLYEIEDDLGVYEIRREDEHALR